MEKSNMVRDDSPEVKHAPNGWVRFWRKIYNPLGFKHGYNFPLFIILVGALMGFVLSRFEYFNVNGVFLKSTVPGDAIHYEAGYKRVGIILHLVGLLIGGFLACFQFVPVIRHTVILLHRVNGYIIIIFLLIGLAGAFMIIPTCAGGSPSTQASVGVLGAVVLISVCNAYYNIKRLRIDLHREWMIRTWVYAGTIISMRLINLAADYYFKQHPQGTWYDVQACSDIWAQYRLFGVPDSHNPTKLLYPACTGPESSVRVAVSVQGSGPENTTAAVDSTFGMNIWLALIIHAVCVEIYFRLTPGEAERLKQVSAERRMEAARRLNSEDKA